MPTSITSAPRASASSMSRPVVSRLGSPATKYGMRARSPRARSRANAWSMRDTALSDHAARLADRRVMAAAGGADGLHVLVAAPREPDDQPRLAWQGGGDSDRVGDGVRGLERGEDALEAREEAEGLEGFLVGHRGVLGPARVLQPGVLGADPGVVQARGDRVRGPNLAVLVLDHIRQAPVEHPGDACRERRPVAPAPEARPGRLDADQPHLGVIEKRMEEP